MRAWEQGGSIERVGVLSEPTRRRLYAYVARRPEGVGRDEAAGAAGISRALAAFHLDRLVAAGLLEVFFRRRSGRAGPGAGRPAKMYRRAARVVSVALPPRDYGFAARLLAQAIEGSEPGRKKLWLVARRWGKVLGREVCGRVEGKPTTAKVLRAMRQVLEERGFEPGPVRGGQWRLQNCPFDAIAREHRELVCGMNLALMRGMLAELGPAGWRAELAPLERQCCVAFRAAGRRR